MQYNRPGLRKKKSRLGSAIRILLLSLAGLVAVFPFVWMVISSLKTKAEVMNTDVFFPADPQWGNWVEVIFNSPLLRYVGNSLFVSVVLVAYQMFSGALLAYALVFFRFKGRGALFAVIMGTYMVPAAAMYIPAYIILSRMNLLDTYTGLIVSSMVSIFGVFLLRQAFLQVPYELVEAGRVDGASHFQILWRLLFPYCRATFITFGVMSFITSYNNYMWPSLITSKPELSLVSQGLRRFFIEEGAFGTDWPMVMAGSALIVIPLLVLFCFTQKWFVAGIGGDTGSKG